MLFSEADAPHLKKWIVKRLENTSDADADVLADYVLALLRHDGDENTVRQLCEAEIPDFLKEDSSLFVQDVFDCIQYKSFLPGAPPPPSKLVAAPFLPPNGPSAMYNGGMGGMNGGLNGSRKRSFHEQAGSDMNDFQYGTSNFKQPRRGGTVGRGGRFDNYDNNRGGRQFQSPASVQQQIPGFPSLPPMPNSMPNSMPGLDANDPIATMLAIQQVLGFQMPGMPQSPFSVQAPASPGSEFRSSGGVSGQKPRCRDFDQKGFCARGSNCHFQHASGIYLPPADEYDPSNSSLLPAVPSPTNGAASSPYSPFVKSERGGYDSGRGRGNSQRGDRGGQRGGNAFRRGGRAEFSSDRPNYDRSNTTIVVENIPEDKFSEEAVCEFFSTFGNIQEVTMRPYKRLAIVKYDDWNSAKNAYSSPNVIFDNRFVKVYWYTSQESLPQPPSVPGTNGGAASNGRHGSATPGSVPVPAYARSASEASVDLEEFAIKQQEAQRLQEEKAKKRAETQAAIQEMKAKQEALLKNHAEEQKRLFEKLAAKTGTPIKTEGVSVKNEDSEIERLKAVLASKKAEAERIGAVDSEMTPADDSYAWRGRGRGRGGYRGRGAYVPRGGFRGYDRGGYRGGRGGFAVGVGAYNLDNRPKKVVITGVDFTDPKKNESLREHILGYETTEIETGFEKTYIAFADRKTAERFLAASPNGQIPNINEKVEINWVPNASLPVPKSSTTSSSYMKQEDTNMDEGDAMAQMESERDGVMGGASSSGAMGLQHEIDYDVADDNDWN